MWGTPVVICVVLSDEGIRVRPTFSFAIRFKHLRSKFCFLFFLKTYLFILQSSCACVYTRTGMQGRGGGAGGRGRVLSRFHAQHLLMQVGFHDLGTQVLWPLGPRGPLHECSLLSDPNLPPQCLVRDLLLPACWHELLGLLSGC